MKYLNVIFVIAVLVACSSQAAVRSECRVCGWIDRIEGDWAVVEQDLGEVVLISSTCFPGAIDGDRVTDGAIDAKATREMEQRIARLLGKLKMESVNEP